MKKIREALVLIAYLLVKSNTHAAPGSKPKGKVPRTYSYGGGADTRDESQKHYRSFVRRTKNCDLPKEFDARKEWPHCDSIGTIWDQGNCWSCWAVAAASVITDRVCIQLPGTQFWASASELVRCGDKVGNNQGCKEGKPHLAYKYWAEYGVVSGGPTGTNNTCQPYDLGSVNKCSYPKCKF